MEDIELAKSDMGMNSIEERHALYKCISAQRDIFGGTSRKDFFVSCVGPAEDLKLTTMWEKVGWATLDSLHKQMVCKLGRSLPCDCTFEDLTIDKISSIISHDLVCEMYTLVFETELFLRKMSRSGKRERDVDVDEEPSSTKKQEVSGQEPPVTEREALLLEQVRSLQEEAHKREEGFGQFMKWLVNWV
jgi:hypothetical protein